ncbi:Voltage-gated hydrogen channel 1 [Acropora cervicornis]|uniref:Voltage-gated hydrogen channel 1 n=1 Tax=Acropora cervicornis TaxID=6130 RepID=A0AAD9R5H6_ACRCE|nr:Voltage-gated hydrogen channel 1 [Acropora cervicornis]
MERSALYSDISDSKDTDLDIYNIHRSTIIDTETEDTSDESDADCRVTRLETSNKRSVLLDSPPNPNGSVYGKMADINDENAQEPSSRDVRPRPNSNPTDKESPQHESDAPSAAGYHPPEEENELFSTEYVDKLVASFWSKVDQKIETAVSHYQSSPQADRQTNVDNDAQTATNEKEHAQEDKKTPLSKSHRGVCVYILFIFQFLKKIFDLCRDKIQTKKKHWFTDGMWRDDLRVLITHRHANFTIVLVTVIDCFLVVANILADFNVIDDHGIEVFFTGFLFINLTIMFLFLTECILKIIVLRRDLLQDKMEVFDVALMGFYLLAEVISSHGFSDIESPYPKYLHMIVILRCWRILLVLEELHQEKEVELSAMESQTQQK